jgi:hypothetical protein
MAPFCVRKINPRPDIPLHDFYKTQKTLSGIANDHTHTFRNSVCIGERTNFNERG